MPSNSGSERAVEAVPPRALSDFFQRPGMFLPRTNFDTAVAFLLGFDQARDSEPLAGLREWLIMQLGHGENFAWPELVLRIAYPEAGARPRELPAADQERLLGLLFETIAEFWKDRARAGGFQEITRRYADWEASRARDAVGMMPR
jgi:hypothetical protein